MQLRKFDNQNFDRGKPSWIEVLWLIVQGIFFSSWLPGSWWRCNILRAFGAAIEERVTIKPRVYIKFPWRLSVGSDTWIGEGVWIDNLANVNIAANVCISQGGYICTGNHNYQKESFDLITKPVWIADESWLCAHARIAPGVNIRKGSVVGFGSVLTTDTEEEGVYLGNPAKFTKKRY